MKQYDFMKDSDGNGAESITIEHTPKRRVDMLPRIICMLLALGIWIYMFNINDADATDTITLRIELSGEDTLAEEGMMVYGFDERSVTVTIKGTNRDLKRFAESEYKAVVDVIGIAEAKVNNLPITVKVPANSSLSVESMTPGTVIVISDYKDEKVISNLEAVFGSVSEGKFDGELSVSEISISGPREIVSKIVRAEFKIEGEISDGTEVSSFTSIKYFDINDDEIDTRGAVAVLTKDIFVTVYEDTATEESDSAESESEEITSGETESVTDNG